MAGSPAERHPRSTRSIVIVNEDKKARRSASVLELEDEREDGYAEYAQRHRLSQSRNDWYYCKDTMWGTKKEDQGDIKATWLAHTCLLVDLPLVALLGRGTRVLFDPVFCDRCSPSQFLGPKRYRNPSRKIPEVDGVVISRNPYDQYVSFSSALLPAGHTLQTDPPTRYIPSTRKRRLFQANRDTLRSRTYTRLCFTPHTFAPLGNERCSDSVGWPKIPMYTLTRSTLDMWRYPEILTCTPAQHQTGWEGETRKGYHHVGVVPESTTELRDKGEDGLTEYVGQDDDMGYRASRRCGRPTHVASSSFCCRLVREKYKATVRPGTDACPASTLLSHTCSLNGPAHHKCNT
ncbi:uncharacterized protein ARMOST_20111 [Armillaria ostoyae]|uniref:Uncharacterized protein n=1 Tax=Armillaria ostoyae TaxID=47428 RepID=A0A284S6F8_ARMOS|nr:uncharacterized protein ARMOST_20111 [Armillaria ostoyae]